MSKKPAKTIVEDARPAKVVFFDIETSPNIVYTWSTRYDETSSIKIIKDWKIIAFAYKYQGAKKTYSFALPDFPSIYRADKTDDSALVKALWEVFNDADILVAHNGDKFDIRKANAKFIGLGLTPPSPYKTIDTKKIFGSVAAFESNSLKDLARSLTKSVKMETGGFSLWEGCMAGDKKSWNTMKKYNAQDVTALEAVYNVARPWAKKHPSTTVFGGVPDVCPRCGGTHLQRRGYTYTALSKKPKLQCTDCGAWCSGAGSVKTGVTVS